MLIYAPDAIDIAPETLSAVSGIPTMRGYQSPPAASSSLASALENAPKGGSVVITLNGSQRVFAGTANKLFEFSSGAWSNVSRGGNYEVLSVPAVGFKWRFAAFGDNIYAATGPKALFTNVSTAVPLQYMAHDGSTFTNTNGPAASCIAAVGQFLFVGNTFDATMSPSPGFGEQGNRWWCSAVFDGTDWDPDVRTQCASGLLVATPGEITAIAELSGQCVVYKNSSIYVGYYSGPPEVWKFEVREVDIGCYTQEAVVVVGARHYFIGDSDIYVFDGSHAVSIGAGVREWFFARITREGLSKIQSLHDQVNQLIYWFYPANGSSTLDSVLVYHYGNNRFGAFSFTVSEVLELVGGPAPVATGSTTTAQLAKMYLDGSYVAKALTGTGTALTFTTSWYGDIEQYSLARRIRTKFRTAPSSGTVTHSTCAYIGGTVSTGSAVNWGSGRADLLASGRYHRDAHSYSGDCEIEMLKPELEPEGFE